MFGTLGKNLKQSVTRSRFVEQEAEKLVMARSLEPTSSGLGGKRTQPFRAPEEPEKKAADPPPTSKPKADPPDHGDDDDGAGGPKKDPPKKDPPDGGGPGGDGGDGDHGPHGGGGGGGGGGDGGGGPSGTPTVLPSAAPVVKRVVKEGDKMTLLQYPTPPQLKAWKQHARDEFVAVSGMGKKAFDYFQRVDDPDVTVEDLDDTEEFSSMGPKLRFRRS